MQRMTKTVLRAKADLVSRMTGQEIIVSGAYGGHGVRMMVPGSTGQRDLMGGHHTAREAGWFLDGMIQAASILADGPESVGR